MFVLLKRMTFKVIYDDGDIEILRLHKERWEILEDYSSQKDHGLDFQGHAVSSVTIYCTQSTKLYIVAVLFSFHSLTVVAS